MITWNLIIWALVAIASYSYYAGSLGLAVVFAIVAVWFLWVDIKASKQEASVIRFLESHPSIGDNKQASVLNTGYKIFDGVNRIALIGFFIFCVILLVKFVGTLA